MRSRPAERERPRQKACRAIELRDRVPCGRILWSMGSSCRRCCGSLTAGLLVFSGNGRVDSDMALELAVTSLGKEILGSPLLGILGIEPDGLAASMRGMFGGDFGG